MEKYLGCASTSGFISIQYITIVKPLKRRQMTTSGNSVLSEIMNSTNIDPATDTAQKQVDKRKG